MEKILQSEYLKEFMVNELHEKDLEFFKQEASN